MVAGGFGAECMSFCGWALYRFGGTVSGSAVEGHQRGDFDAPSGRGVRESLVQREPAGA